MANIELRMLTKQTGGGKKQRGMVDNDVRYLQALAAT